MPKKDGFCLEEYINRLERELKAKGHDLTRYQLLIWMLVQGGDVSEEKVKSVLYAD